MEAQFIQAQTCAPSGAHAHIRIFIRYLFSRKDAELRSKGHVGTAPAMQEESDFQRSVRVEPFRRTLRRIFNNGSWQQGGRLYGGFWMNRERSERFERIRIDGEEIANVDYQALFPRLAYVRAQVAQPTGDVYDITEDGDYRQGWKTLFNALLFAEKPIQRWPTGARALLHDDMNLREAVGAITQRHAPIAPLFETGLGLS